MQINLDSYDYEMEVKELINELINSNPSIKFKICKKCLKAFPIHQSFFNKEKRIKDGFENSCKKCRGLNYNFNPKPSIEYNLENTIVELYEMYLQYDVLPYPKFMRDHYKELFIYTIETKLKMNNDEILKLRREWFQDYKFYGVLTHIYNGIIYDFINDIYPGRFKPWDFPTVGSLYWKDENNIINALNWFVNELINDNIISEIKELPSIVTTYLFKQYSLGSLLSIYFNNSPYLALNYIYPNHFNESDFKNKSSNYYKSEENRIKSFRQFIEVEHKLDIDKLPKLFSFMYLIHYDRNLYSMIRNYYDSDLFSIIDVCYPNKFNETDFPYKNHYEALDGTILKSEWERMIHHIFINNTLNINYECDRFTNKGKTYRPDWTLYHNDKKVIIEFYGLLRSDNALFKYHDKTYEKRLFYNELVNINDDILYIELVREDLDNNFSGLVDKFKHIGLKLKVD